MFGKASPSISPSRVPSSQPGANETIVVVLVDEEEVDVVDTSVDVDDDVLDVVVDTGALLLVVDEVEDDVELLVLVLVVELVLDDVVVVEVVELTPGMPTHAPPWQ